MNIKPLRACPFCEARAIASDDVVTIFHKKDCHLWSYNNMDHGIERFGIHDLSKWDNRPLEQQMYEALKVVQKIEAETYGASYESVDNAIKAYEGGQEGREDEAD